jgi:DNA-binding beta-propeller fold protein YncE
MRNFRFCGAFFLAACLTLNPAHAQVSTPCVNDAPDPYQRGVSFAHLPDGRPWGSTAGVAVAPDGTIWAYDRCGANSCSGSTLDPIVAFSPDGNVLRHFGGGMLQMPHGLMVDKDGNVWVTDNAANGDIYVAQNHTAKGDKSLVLVFSPNGKFIRSFGGKGSGAGELDVPHSLAFDAQGLLYVGDRNHNRIAIFNSDGTYLRELKQFSRPSAIVIMPDQTIYVGDSESQSRDAHAYAYNPGCEKGIRFGKLGDAKVFGLLPDQQPMSVSSTAEGIAVDKDGDIFGAEVGPKDLKKYSKKP